MDHPFEIGVFTFGEITADPATGRPLAPARRLREFLDLARLADEAGLDVFGVGEHHRPDFAIASPPVVLAAAAQATERIRLTSTVTVLSTADPVRVFEDFTALDLASDGRAEITAGRGAYVESFPLFGFDLDDYDALFDEKLDLLLRLRDHERVSWSGQFRPALDDAGVYPRPVQTRLPVWVGVGGTPASVVRAARHGLPMYLAILGEPARFRPLAQLYRDTAASHSTTPDTRIGVTSHFYAEPTSQGARDTFHPYYARYIGHNMPSARGRPLPREAFDAWASPHGALLAGSPAEIVEKILWEHELLGHDRFLAQIGLGGLPFAQTARSIELLATDILPQVRAALQPTPAPSPGRSAPPKKKVDISTISGYLGDRLRHQPSTVPQPRGADMNITIIGAGNVGSAVAKGAVTAGHTVTVTVPDEAEVQATASQTGAKASTDLAAAVTDADLIVLAVPYGALPDVAATVGEQARDKVIIDATNPLKPDYSGLAVSERSGAEEVQELFTGANVVKAFNTVLAGNQATGEVEGTQLDGLYAGDDEQAKQTVAGLLTDFGYRPIDVGPLKAAQQLEHLAFLNISLNAANGWSWRSGWKLVGPLS